MHLQIDTHTHTIASGHAYSTISEMARAGMKKGLALLAITEHAPKMPGTCHTFYFRNLHVIKRHWRHWFQQIDLLLGAELNIIDYDGTIDLDERSLQCLDIAIASLHMPCIKSGTIEQNTNALIGAMKSPYVSIIGHPDDGRFPVDYEKLVKAAKQYHVLLELNNNSLNPHSFREHTKENDLILLDLCKQYEVPITLGSDAHIADDIARCDFSTPLLKSTNFPKELIVNLSIDQFRSFLKKKNL